MAQTAAHLNPLLPGLRVLPGVILEGKAAVTAAFSKYLAAAMLYPGEGDEPYAEGLETDRILRAIHPDVVYLRPEKSSIPVDAVRAMQREAHIRPNQAPGRVFVLENAGSMTPQAQNAMLKILEAPPAGVRFILTCENRLGLLPTVRSRLVVAPIAAPAADPPTTFSPEAIAVAVRLPDWQRVVEVLGEKAAESVMLDCGQALSAIDSGNGYQLMTLFARHDKKRDDFIQFVLCLRALVIGHLLEQGGPSEGLIAAAHLLQTAADRAGQNVFLPLLGSYTAGRIVGR